MRKLRSILIPASLALSLIALPALALAQATPAAKPAAQAAKPAGGPGQEKVPALKKELVDTMGKIDKQIRNIKGYLLELKQRGVLADAKRSEVDAYVKEIPELVKRVDQNLADPAWLSIETKANVEAMKKAWTDMKTKNIQPFLKQAQPVTSAGKK